MHSSAKLCVHPVQHSFWHGTGSRRLLDCLQISAHAARISVIAGAEGLRAKEGAMINKSLLTLGTVINKLAEGVQLNGEAQ